jgi:hypothetical protein
VSSRSKAETHLRVAFLVAAILIAQGCNDRPAPRSTRTADNDCTGSRAAITDSAVGALHLGMTAAEVRTRCRVLRDTIMLNGDYVENQRAMLVLVGADTVRAWLPEDSINEIDVLGDRLQTEDSLHVRMMLRDLRAIRGLTAVSGEASTWLQVPRHCGIGLVVANAPGMGEDGGEANEAAVRSWPDTIKVRAIRVSRC